MNPDLIVSGGTVVTADGVRDADVAVSDGRIVAVGDGATFPNADRTVDATDCLVLPGVVDPHVHVADMFSGDSYETATAAAALGGVTTFIDFGWQAWEGSESPYDAESTLVEGIERKREKAGDALVDYALHGGLTREDPAVLEELEAAIEMGVTSFKMYTTYEMGVSYGFMDRVFARLADTDGVGVVHTEDPTICDAQTELLREAGRGDPTDYPASRPDYAEAVSAATVARLAAEHGAKYYGFHTTSRKAADEIARVRAAAGPDHVRAETCTHYTALDESVYAERGNQAMISPPIRPPDDQDALFEHLRAGTLDVVSSDHCGYTRADKEADDWWDSAFGANGLQTELPVFHDVAVGERGFPYPFLVRVKSTLPAKLFGLPNKGTIAPGADADIVIFDPDATYEITAEDNASVADFTLYEGREVTGAVESTFVRGEPVVEDGELVGTPGHGEFVARDTPDWSPNVTPR
ncbi:dihydroorotase [Halorarius halobius]|uniref:dihydroorotase n=1 Tax=Halorarius halobius TaxID=2962671 RepID=UPI0020CBBD4B|nr:amidohydrolase family protein [Halorarius halobius]